MNPTSEQEAIIKAFLTGQDLTIEALAGTGKTTTLKMLGNALFDKKGLYVAYNRAIADDAKATFPNNVVCSTANSLAWRDIVKTMYSPFAKRLKNSERTPGRQLAANLQTKTYKLDGKDVALSDVHVAYMIMDTVRRFCNSADTEIKPYHVPFQDGCSDEDMDNLKSICLPKANEVWADVQKETGFHRFEHDHYLKMWQLKNPQLPYDFVMLDEAQDANPVIASVFENQRNVQKVMVGDRNQAIYGWRGALDAMQKFSGIRMYLSQSFRFGDAVADEANKWLKLLEAPMMVKGFDQITSSVELLDDPDVIICRTNSGGVNSIISLQQGGKDVALVGGGKDITNFAYASIDLIKGKKTTHPQLVAFEDWDEVLEYVEDGGGSDLKVSVKLIQTYGAVAVINAMKQLVSENAADIIITTAHKAKGREWDKVKISNDFFPKESDIEGEGLPVPQLSEMMLNYVAVTRAKNVLDVGGLGYVDMIGKKELINNGYN